MQRRIAFTLIELLVVMAIIALLVSILAPSLTKVLALAKDTQCSTNIDAIKKSMMIFCAGNNGGYPTPTNTKPTNGGAPAANQIGVLSRFAFEMGVKGETFVCPATQDAPIVVDPTYDLTVESNGSYSYQISDIATKQITSATENDVIFLADRKPKAGAETTLTGGMSPNHNDGEFIMAASKGATVKRDTRDIGRLNNDIYADDLPDNVPDRDDSELLLVDAKASGS